MNNESQKRSVNKSEFLIIKRELDYLKNKQMISEQQYNKITGLYQIKMHLNYMEIMLIIGALLVGLGILTFVASNWNQLTKTIKFSIIILLICIFNLLSYKFKKNYNRTSKSFMYIALLAYGAGIFLIGQIFNYGGHFTTAFLLWSIGIFPYVMFFRDKILFAVADIFLIIYVTGHFDLGTIPIFIIIASPLIYYINNKLKLGEIITFLNNSVVMFTILYLVNLYIKNVTINIFIFLIIGFMMFYIPAKFHQNIFKIQGNIIYVICGTMFTYSDNWYGFSENLNIFSKETCTYLSIIFAIIFLIYLLYQTRTKNYISLVGIFIIIMRYYFDTFYDFMPKSLFFIIGGLVLLGFGYYFERVRKNGGKVDEE